MSFFSPSLLSRRKFIGLAIGAIVPAPYILSCQASEPSNDQTRELQDLIDQGGAEITLPARDFLISQPLRVTRTMLLRGSPSGTRIIQNGFPVPGLVITANGCRIETMRLVRPAQPLVTNWGWFHGLHGSSQDSAVFVLSVGDCQMRDLDIRGFARGITFAGGRRGSMAGRPTAGGTIRMDDAALRNLCMRCDNRIVARVRGENGWVPARLDTTGLLHIEGEVSTRNQVRLDLIIGRGGNNLAEGCCIAGAEFGVSFQMQDALRLQDLSFTDTTQVNFGLGGRIHAPAHAIYGADGENTGGLRSGDITIKRVRASRDNCGTTAFKVHGADQVTVEDASCEAFGGIFSFSDLSQLDVRRYEARHCRSIIPERALRGVSIQNVDIVRIADGDLDLAGLSAPLNRENVIFGIRSTDGGRRPTDISVNGLKASVATGLPDTVRLDIVRIYGDALKQSEARIKLDGLRLAATENAKGLVGLRAADASELVLRDSTIENFDVPIVLGASLGHFEAVNATYRRNGVVDRRRSRH